MSIISDLVISRHTFLDHDAADASLAGETPGEAEATLTNKVHRDSALGLIKG